MYRTDLLFWNIFFICVNGKYKNLNQIMFISIFFKSCGLFLVGDR